MTLQKKLGLLKICSSSLIHRGSPTFRLITRTVSEAHSLQGPLTQCMARTLTGIANTATGTVDPTIAGELFTVVKIL